MCKKDVLKIFIMRERFFKSFHVTWVDFDKNSDT